MTQQAGFACKLYYNTGTDGSPTWNEVPNVDDLDIANETDEADVSNRAGGGWEHIIPGLKKVTISFGMIHDASDADYVLLRDAQAAGTLKDFAVASGAIATVGTEYLRLYAYVTKFGREEKLREGVKSPVTLRPGFSSSRNPAWVDVTS